ncbi:MAG: pro-sigmaK processing inhibitor BofA family protein [Ndongobacter sp.]|nr:pro-sigmaK processing inhibitor BofA family protein [Ndongobacter sp.]
MFLIFGLVGIGILWLVSTLLKLSMKVFWKLLVNGIFGVLLLTIANIGAAATGIVPVEIGPVRAVLAGVLGLPYVAFLLIKNAMQF